MSIINTFEALGDRAPIPCDISEADAVAMAFMEPGLTLTPLPFKHSPLLPNEIWIRVTHAGLCHSDIFNADLSWSKIGYYPLVTGHEVVGIVEKVGSAVAGCCDICNSCQQAYDNSCFNIKLTYKPYFGGYATGFQTRADFFYHLRDNMPGEAAPLFCAGLTVYAPLKEYVIAGMKVGVIGIRGLGHLGLKIASKMGCEVTAISTSASKEAEARSYGAQHFLNLKDPEQVHNAANSLDFILNTTTSFKIGELMQLVKPR